MKTNTNIIDRAGNYIEKHQHKGFFSYVIYFSVLLFMISTIIVKVIYNFFFGKKLKHQ